uniref:sialate O-acetylesterase n=1 Tax=Zobellia alginiliquefaciens TaxID=3032586 RepID=UPI0023E3B8BF|nr:sialate O-acetylesterase [Zobellia alginiliquefaciens]
MTRLKYLIASLLICLGTAMALGQSLKAAHIFGDDMVLQREKQVPIWGTSSPNEKITVSFGGQSKTTQSGADGKWMVKLDPLEASSDPRKMIITGKSEVTISNILVGEVWICSGQSNMFFPTSKVPEATGLIPFIKNIRTFDVQNTVALEEQEEVKGQWQAKHPNSAVAISFAYFLHTISDVPVGIIKTAWGSSSIEAWMPREMTEVLPHFKTIMQEFDSDSTRLARIKEIISTASKWSNKDDIYLRRQPNILYNAMMHPLIPFACRGLLWYQGERNTRYMSGMPEVGKNNWFHRVSGMRDYEDVLKKWILNYRKQWQDHEMHFMVTMLPGYGGGPENQKKIDPESPTAPSWAWMRESQMASLDLPHTSVINTIDLGDVTNIHPTDKLPIGQRAALLAADKTLHKNVPSEGPSLKNIKLNGNKLVVYFNNSTGLRTINMKVPSGFWIADDSKKWVSAEAVIDGESVILSSPEIEKPKYVRYAFAGKPNVNLVNAYGLPAYPFRTDNWDK